VRLLDTDIIIDLQRGVAAAQAWLASLAEPPLVCVFTLLEVMQDARNKNELRRSKAAADQFSVLCATEEDQLRAVAYYEALHLSHGIELADTLIAAVAVGAGATLVTFNLKHYRHIPGLTTEQPYTR
jgi:predicted nucleic acid-binding protein